MTIDEQLAIIQRGTDEILPLDELKTKLKKNKPLRIKLGMDLLLQTFILVIL